MQRQIILDTETTGTEPLKGDRIVEIGAVEMINRRLTGQTFHVYLNPDREMDDEVIGVHGITNEFLVDKPRFAEVAADFLAFIQGAQLIIHNAPFDLGFLNMEYRALDAAFVPIEKQQLVIDTLVMARNMHPGQRNSLDALCKRYAVDNSARTLHGALLDSEILADVYLAMTGGQVNLFDAGQEQFGVGMKKAQLRVTRNGEIPVIAAHAHEKEAHEALMNLLTKKSGNTPLWKQQENETASD